MTVSYSGLNRTGENELYGIDAATCIRAVPVGDGPCCSGREFGGR